MTCAILKHVAISLLALPLALTIGCQRLPSADELPVLPVIDSDDFVSPVRAQIDDAIAAVEAAPTDAEVNGQLALTLATYGLTDAALSVYARTRMLAPNESRWAYAHAHLLGRSVNPDGAIAILEPAFARRSNNFWLGYELADQYLAVGRFQESIELFERLTDRFPDKFQAVFGLGRAQLRAGHIESAIVSLSRAADMQPGIGEIHFLLGDAYRQNGRPDQATRHFDLATQHENNKIDGFNPVMQTMASLDRSTQPHLYRARRLFEQHRYPEAIDVLEAALAIDPTRQDAQAHLVLLYGVTGQSDKAIALYEKALDLGADGALLHLNMGMVLRRAGQPARARAVLKKSVAADIGVANAHAELGLVEDQLGDKEAALASFEIAAKLDTEHQIANFMLGRHYAEVGDNSRAVEHLESAVATETAATPAYLRTLAGVYIRLDQYQTAVDALLRAKNLLASSGAMANKRGAALNLAIDQDLDAARDAALTAAVTDTES